MNRKLTAPTRPRIASGVANCTSDVRITTLTMSAAPMTASASTESQTWCREREHHGRDAEHDDRLKHPHSHSAGNGVAGKQRRHRQRADGWRGTQYAQSPRSGLQNVTGVDRQKRGGAAQQHGEQVERDRAQDRRIAPDKADAGEQLVKCRRVFFPSGRASRLDGTAQ